MVLTITYFVIGLIVFGTIVIGSRISRINGVDGSLYIADKITAIIWMIMALLWPLTICLLLYMIMSHKVTYEVRLDGTVDATTELF